MKNLVLSMIYFFVFVFNGFGQVTNPENQYDYVGNLHNDAMRYVFEKVSAKGEKPEAGELEGWIMEWFKGMVSPGGMNIDEKEAIKLINQAFNKKLDIQSHSPSSTFSGYYFNLGQLISNYRGGEKNLNPFFNEVKKLEHTIMKAKMDEKEKEVLLVASSVARYSMLYWITEGSKWTDLSWADEAQEFIWGDVGRADMQGAGAGALIGAFAGTVTIPLLGTVAGWVAGGLLGGVGGSLGDALWQLL